MAKQSVQFKLGGVEKKKDVEALKRELDTVPGVLSVSVNTKKGRVSVAFDDTGTGTQLLAGQIQKLGYQVQEAGSHIM